MKRDAGTQRAELFLLILSTGSSARYLSEAPWRMLRALWPLGRRRPLPCTRHEEDSNSLVAGGLVQEVTEHEQVVYGTRALDRGPVRDDTSEPSPAPNSLAGAGARGMGSGLGRTHAGPRTATS